MTCQAERMSRDLETILQGRGFPVRFVYGNERFARETGRTLVVNVKRDREASDTFGMVGAERNARRVRVRNQALEAYVYVSASAVGAREGEHESECDKVVDALLVALYEWGSEARAGELPLSEGRYLSGEEIAGEASQPFQGVVYRLRFSLPRGVARREYDGSIEPTAAIASTHTTTYVQQAGGDF